MKIAILIYDGFTALDAVGPYEVLSCLPEAKVHFISTEVGPKASPYELSFGYGRLHARRYLGS